MKDFPRCRLLAALLACCCLSQTGAFAQIDANHSRVGLWRFNDARCIGDNGAMPVQALDVNIAPSFDGGGLQMTNSKGISLLKYHTLEANGRTNLFLRNGSIRFWYKPFWGSMGNDIRLTRRAQPQWARLLSIGSPKEPAAGWLDLSVSPERNKIWIHSGLGTNTWSASSELILYANQWFAFTLSTGAEPGSATRVTLWKDQFKIIDLAVPNLPWPVQTTDFCVGTSADGTEPAQGLIDELETYNYPVGPIELRRTDQILSAFASASPPSIRLSWEIAPYFSPILQRRAAGDPGWSILATNLKSWEYTDTNVTVGQRYEYRVCKTALGSGPPILAGVNVQPIEGRGKVIVLVDETVAGPLAPELDQLKTDLVGDGWQVLRHEVARHDDAVWANNSNHIAQIKALVLRDCSADPGLVKMLLIVGHVATPYSGNISPDGHPGRPWPCDGYYPDKGSWTDASNYGPQNMPGDGRFDQARLPGPVEVGVGRVDFALLPFFTEAAGPNRKSEVDLLRQYLKKDHRYRNKQFSLPERTAVGAYFNAVEDNIVYDNALSLSSRLYGFQHGRIGSMGDEDIFADARPSLWGLQGGYGGPFQIYSADARRIHRSDELVSPAREPAIGFFMLKGSYFGEWSVPNNLMRSCLALPNYGLGVVYTRSDPWHWESLGMGEPLGSALVRTQNDPGLPHSLVNIYLSVMGDPTLRMQVLAPPAGLTVSRSGNQATLNWRPTPESGSQYWVYRSSQGLDGPFTRLTQAPLRSTTFTDPSPAPGGALYQVRALKLTVTGSGSFTNLSQAAFGPLN